MSISALIIDDEQLARDELKYLLDQVGGVEVVAQGANGIEAVDLIEEHHPDLVFLDVQMPGLDGFAVIQRLMERHKPRTARQAEPLPQIVFATAYDQYAVRAFDVNAVDYLLKPFDRARVQQAVERVRGRMATGGARGCERRSPESQLDALLRLLNRPQGAGRSAQPAKLIVQAQSRLLLVDQAEICYAAIDEGVIRVVTQTFEGQSKCRTLEELLELLDPARLLARPSRLRGEHQPHSRSGAVVQVELSAAHERQAADRDPGEPRADQAAARVVQSVSTALALGGLSRSARR